MSEEGPGQGPSFSPQRALTLALTDWLEELLSTDQPGGPRPPRALQKASPEEEPMQMEEGDPVHVPGPGENPLYTAEPLTLEDLVLLAELFYLPYEHGPRARTMLEELDWLKNHSQGGEGEGKQTAEWYSRADRFDDMCGAVVRMFNRLSNAPNRSVLYDLYNYICDIKSGVGLARAYVKTLGGRGLPSAQLMNNDPEPWGFRGGLSGEFQRMLPCHGNRDLFRHPPMTTVYSIRPYCPQDQAEVQRIHMEMQRDGGEEGKISPSSQHELLSDGLPAGRPPPSPQCGLVLEDDWGVCGYALGLPQALAAASHHQRAQYESVLGDFPSLLAMQLLPRVSDPAPARRMMGSLLSSLKTSGSRGVFCELRQTDRRMLDFFTQTDAFKTLKMAAPPQSGVVVMGTVL